MQVRRVRRQTRTHIAQLGTYLVHFTHIRNRGRIGHHLMDARTDFRPVRGSAIQTDPRFTQPQGTQTLFSHRRTRRRTPQVDHAPTIGRTISKNRAHQRSVIRTVRHIHNERTTRSNSFNNILLLRRQIACATFFPRIAIGWNRIRQYAMSVLASFLIASQSTHNIRAQNMLSIVILAVQLRSRMPSGIHPERAVRYSPPARSSTVSNSIYSPVLSLPKERGCPNPIFAWGLNP